MTHDPLCPSASSENCECWKDGSGIHSCGWGPCQCDLITAAHERGYKEAEESNKNKKLTECLDSPYGRHGNFIFTKKEDLCGFCHKNITYLFEMGQ